MIFQDDQQVIDYIRENLILPKHIQDARVQTRELKALITGKGFADELINRIEHIEDAQKKVARKKYARPIRDMFTRLLRPIDNVYHSTGGSRTYTIQSDEQKRNLLKQITNIRGGQSLSSWLESHWMELYHTDPAGVIFLEYSTKEGGISVWPTYKSVFSIRNYIPNGQKVETILFEPLKTMIDDTDCVVWRLVDDVKDYFVKQVGNSFTILTEGKFATFEHPFGEVPALINSNIQDLDESPAKRLSPIFPIQELTKEIARDNSILTIYKFQKGFPIHWRYVMKCQTCNGSKKNGTDTCSTCNSYGYMKNNDVTDMVTLPIPDSDQMKLAPDIAGYISPDLDTWDQFVKEIERLEDQAQQTLWGATKERKNGNETATGRWLDVQPVTNTLNKYADVAERMETAITEWVANAIIPAKDKSERVSQISYGRRYIIESPDIILNRYNEAKDKGDSITILDRIFNEYITSKFKNDPVHLRLELIKSKVEPYIHYTAEQVSLIFGQEEAQKKVLFGEWWKTIDLNTLDSPEALQSQFNDWINNRNQSIIV